MTGDSFTVKETLIRLEAKLDAHMIESAKQHSDFMERMSATDARQVSHEADNHVVVVQRLDDDAIREAGRKDVLRYIFGTSVIAIVCGVGGLALSVVKLIGG